MSEGRWKTKARFWTVGWKYSNLSGCWFFLQLDARCKSIGIASRTNTGEFTAPAGNAELPNTLPGLGAAYLLHIEIQCLEVFGRKRLRANLLAAREICAAEMIEEGAGCACRHS